MDLTKCLMITLAITLSLGFVSCAVLYILYKISDNYETWKHKPMEQRTYKVTFSSKARLYTGYNFTGDWDEYYFTDKDPIKCFNLQKPRFVNQIKSVDTFGTCIRLFSTGCCKGQSMAYYPKKIILNANGPEFDVQGVQSLSPCFPDELDKAVSDKEKMEKTKTGPLQSSSAGKVVFKSSRHTTTIPPKVLPPSHIIPDDLCIGMQCGYIMRTRQLPIKFYRVGPGGRVEFIWAEIHRNNVTRFEEEEETEERRDPPILNGEGEAEPKILESDHLGHFIGARLGPQNNLPFENIFPQSRNNEKLLKAEEDKVLDMVRKEEEEIWVSINVVYQGEDSTRPIGFVYRIQQPHDLGDVMVSQNYLPNLLSPQQ